MKLSEKLAHLQEVAKDFEHRQENGLDCRWRCGPWDEDLSDAAWRNPQTGDAPSFCPQVKYELHPLPVIKPWTRKQFLHWWAESDGKVVDSAGERWRVKGLNFNNLVMLCGGIKNRENTVSLADLAEYCTQTDGSPCGVDESVERETEAEIGNRVKIAIDPFGYYMLAGPTGGMINIAPEEAQQLADWIKDHVEVNDDRT